MKKILEFELNSLGLFENCKLFKFVVKALLREIDDLEVFRAGGRVLILSWDFDLRNL